MQEITGWLFLTVPLTGEYDFVIEPVDKKNESHHFLKSS